MTSAALWDQYAEHEQAEHRRADSTAEQVRNLRDTVFPLTRGEAKKRAERVSREAMEIATDYRQAPDTAGAQLRALCAEQGVEYPASDYGTACEVARLQDVGWWGRKIRVTDWRAYEERQIMLGRVRHFVSDEIATARTWHRAELADMLSRLVAVRDDGAAFMTLADLAATGTSNPAIRRAEMIVRAKGLARWRADMGYTWTFVTLTAPSKYHRLRTESGRLVDNPKWQGATPRDTQQYHAKVWARIRAALHRAGIDWSAFRTVEPHADGTPHWHMCLFTSRADQRQAKDICERHALAEDGSEPGAKVHRCTFEDYRAPEGAGADDAAAMADRCIAYLIAYVSKNIDGNVADAAGAAGQALDTIEGATIEVGDAVESARRVEAWATLWGIRQFAELGGSRAVSAYRELRRIREPLADAEIEPARAAADAGDYRAFIGAARQIGLELWAENTADRLRTEADAAGLPFEPSPDLAAIAVEKGLLNKWGEPVRRWVRGVKALGRTVLTRINTWAIVDSAGLEQIALGKAAAAYWTEAAKVAVRYSLEAEERAVALAPGFFFSRAAPPRALDLCE